MFYPKKMNVHSYLWYFFRTAGLTGYELYIQVNTHAHTQTQLFSAMNITDGNGVSIGGAM